MANKMKPSSLSKITDYKNLSGNEFFPVYLTGENFSITLDVLKKYIGVSGGGTAYVDFTSIDSNVIPDTDNTRILGNTNKSWKSLTLGDALFFKKGDEVVSLQFGTSATLRVNGSLEIDGGLTIGEYSLSSLLDDKQNKISDLNDIRSNSQLGAEAHGWGNHAEAGYATNSSVTQKLAQKQAKLTASSGIDLSSSNTLSIRLGTYTELFYDDTGIVFSTGISEGENLGVAFNHAGGLYIKLGDGLAYGDNGEIVNTREAGKDVDLSGYYTKSETDSKVDALKNEILGGASGAYDTLKEIETILEKNKGEIGSLLTVIDEYSSKFQGEIDGLWSRNSFDELLIGHAAADTVAVGEMFADKLNIGEAVLQYDSYNEGLALSTSLYIEGSEVALVSQLATAEQKSKWNEAYGWGNHASQGYVTKSYVDSNFVTNDRAINFAEYGQFLNINNGTITIDGVSIKPLTSHQTLYSLTLKDSAGKELFSYDPTTAPSGGYVYQLTKSMVGLGNVENTALSSWKGSANITTLGTITSGAWNGSKIGQSYLDLSGYAKSSELGSLAKKNSLIASDIPDLSGTYQTKITEASKLPSSLVSGLGTASTYGVSTGDFTASEGNLVVGAAVYSHVTNRLKGYATQSWVEGKNYLTGITSAQVTGALGYTPTSLTENDLITKGFVLSTALANYLPLSGGIMKTSSGIYNESDQNGYAAIGFNFDHNAFGSLTFPTKLRSSSADVLLHVGLANSQYTLIHSGNIGSQTVAAANSIVNSSNQTLLHQASGFITATEGLRIGNNHQYCGLYPNIKVTSGGNEKDLWLYNQENLRLFGATGVSINVSQNANIILASSNGNVGIGTANPEAMLHVAGNTIVNGDILVKGQIGGSNNNWRIVKSGGTLYIQAQDANSGNNGSVALCGHNATKASRITLYSDDIYLQGDVRSDGDITSGGSICLNITNKSFECIKGSNTYQSVLFSSDGSNFYTLGAACSYGATSSVTSGSSSLVTSGGVASALSGYLPLSGDTVTRKGTTYIQAATGSDQPLGINSEQDSISLRFHNKHGNAWLLYYGNTDEWRVSSLNWTTSYKLIHSGNYATYLDGYAPMSTVEAVADHLTSTQGQVVELSTKLVLLEKWVGDLEGDYFEAKDSLQAQIDSLWARNSFDELYATHVMSDTLAVEEMFTDKLTIGDAPIEYVANEGLKLSTAIYIDGSSVALSNQLPTTAQKNNWNTAYGWGNHASAGYASLKNIDGHTFIKLSGGIESEDSWALRIGTDFFSSSVQSAVYADYYSASVYLGTPNYRWLSVYALSYDQSSDATLKDVVGDTSLTLSQIANAPAVSFTWKYNGKKDVGTLAQYWKDVLPEIVSGEEGNMGMNYAALGVVSAIILARNVETHEQRISRLERENEELRNEILTLKNR